MVSKSVRKTHNVLKKKKKKIVIVICNLEISESMFLIYK